MRRVTAVVCVLLCAGCGMTRTGAAPAPPSARTHARTSATSPSAPGTASGTAAHRPASLAVGAANPGAAPVAADRPTRLGRQLVAAERAVLDPHSSSVELRAAARTTQVAYARLSGHPGWEPAVLRLAPASLRGTIAANVRARRQLAAIPGPPPRGRLPAWRIQAPAPASRLLAWYRAAGARFGVGWQYLAAVNLVESTLGKVRGPSSAGAQGPLQFMPATWAAYGHGGNLNDPHDAIVGAARFLAAHGLDRGHVAGALVAYNPSRHYANAVRALAAVLSAHPREFAGYYRWDVYAATSAGVLLLPQGFDRRRPTSARRYARAHPGRVLR